MSEEIRTTLLFTPPDATPYSLGYWNIEPDGFYFYKPGGAGAVIIINKNRHTKYQDSCLIRLLDWHMQLDQDRWARSVAQIYVLDFLEIKRFTGVDPDTGKLLSEPFEGGERYKETPLKLDGFPPITLVLNWGYGKTSAIFSLKTKGAKLVIGGELEPMQRMFAQMQLLAYIRMHPKESYTLYWEAGQMYTEKEWRAKQRRER